MLSESSKGIVVKSKRIVTGNWPAAGWAVLAPDTAMFTPGGCATASNPAIPSQLVLRPSGGNDGRSNPGEGIA
jgi:hypothetical protein